MALPKVGRSRRGDLCAAGLALAFGWAGAHAAPSAAQANTPGCETVPQMGGLRVFLKTADAPWSELVMDAKGLHELARVQTSPIPNANNRGMNVGPSWESQFAAVGQRSIPGMARGYPSAYSPDRRYFASAVFPGATPSGSPHAFAVTELATNATTTIATSLALDTLAWTPDGSTLAVIEARDDDSIRSFAGVVARVFGWRQVYREFWLVAYSLDGRTLCRTLASPLETDVSIRIAWPQANG